MGLLIQEAMGGGAGNIWEFPVFSTQFYCEVKIALKNQVYHRYRGQTSGYQWEEGRGRGSIGVVQGWELRGANSQV